MYLLCSKFIFLSIKYFVCRQLEAIIRISESLAKMSLLPFALESHVDEALRLFQVSTMDAALSGSLSGPTPPPLLFLQCQGPPPPPLLFLQCQGPRAPSLRDVM